MKNNAQSILITGGAGFIGANLVRRLLSQLTSHLHLLVEPTTNLWRLHDVADQLSLHYIDICNFTSVHNLVSLIKPSIIIHLASFGGMPHQQKQSLIYRVNFDATINLVNACKDVGFDCFINTGSSSEYGIQNESMSEMLALEPVSDYGVSKAAATQFCLKEALFNKLPIYTIRPFSVYGDYEMPTRLIPSVLVNALLDKPIALSSPHFVRDFIYIDDMIDMYIAIIQKKPTSAFIFNGGTGIQSSISNIVDITQTLCSHQLKVEWGTQTSRPWEPHVWRADIKQARTVLGWQPQYSLQAGLEKSMEWFNNNITLYHREHYAKNAAPQCRSTMP